MLTGIRSIKGDLDLTYEHDGVVLRGDHVTTKWLTAPEVKPPSLPDPSSEAMMFVVEPTSFRGINGRLLLHWDCARKELRYGPMGVEPEATPTPLPYVLSAIGPWPDQDFAFRFGHGGARLLKAACTAGTTVNLVVDHGAEGELSRLTVRSDERGVVGFTVVDGAACPIPPSPVPEQTVIEMMQDVDRQQAAQLVPVPTVASPPKHDAHGVVVAAQPENDVSANQLASSGEQSLGTSDAGSKYDAVCQSILSVEHLREEFDTETFFYLCDACATAKVLYEIRHGTTWGRRVRDADGVPVLSFVEALRLRLGHKSQTKIRIWLACATIPDGLRKDVPDSLVRHMRLMRNLARLADSADDYMAVVEAFTTGGYDLALDALKVRLMGDAEENPETSTGETPPDEALDAADDAADEDKKRKAQGKRHSKTTGADLRLATGEAHVVHLEGIRLTFMIEPMLVGRSELEALLRASDDLQVKVPGIVPVHVTGKLKR